MKFARHDAQPEPELVPPAELLRHRAALTRAPAAHIRAAHLAAVGADVRERVTSPAGRFASRTLRGAAAVVAALTITTGLAAADVLPAPAGRILSSVSDRITGHRTAPPAEPVEVDATTSRSDGPEQGEDAGGTPPGVAEVEEPAPEAAKAAASRSTTTTTQPSTTTTTAAPTTTTTIPGPTQPGSPTEPIDPATDGGPTDPGTGGGPTDPGTGGGATGPGTDGGGEPTDGGTGGSDTDDSVGTTGVSTTVPTEDPVSPADGSD